MGCDLVIGFLFLRVCPWKIKGSVPGKLKGSVPGKLITIYQLLISSVPMTITLATLFWKGDELARWGIPLGVMVGVFGFVIEHADGKNNESNDSKIKRKVPN